MKDERIEPKASWWLPMDAGHMLKKKVGARDSFTICIHDESHDFMVFTLLRFQLRTKICKSQGAYIFAKTIISVLK